MNLTNILKNSGTFTNLNKNGLASYLLTDNFYYILVGSSENEFLILSEGDVLSNLTKNLGTLSNILKNG